MATFKPGKKSVSALIPVPPTPEIRRIKKHLMM
jgi:hypothetical protein